MAKTNPSKSTAKPNADAAAKAAAAEKAKTDAAAAQAVADEKAKADAEAAQAAADEKAKADAEAAQAAADEQAKADAEAKALAEAAKPTGKVPALRVTASRDGFRRGGRAWNKGENIVAVSELTDEQIKQIKGEDKLTVEEIEVAAE